jgi:DNA-binding transcriptional LysR family regulator
MELRHLRYFAAVAQELNFTRAAERLRVAQPALSRQIRDLENELGVQLLDRNRRSVRLTAAGQAFLTEAEALLRQSEQAVRVAQQSGQTAQGSLRIGYVWGLFHSLVPAAISLFRQTHPEVAVHLFDLSATQQASAMLEGRLDAGFIGFADEADTARLAKQKVAECSFLAVVPESHAAARKSRVRLAALASDLFFVISDEHFPGASRCVLDACAAAGFRPKILQSADRGHTILGLIASNCGVALLPESLRALPHPGVVFRPLADPPTADLFVAWSTVPPNPLRDRFLNSLQTID